MANDKEPKENVPLVQMNGQNTLAEDGNGEREPSNSISINERETISESITIDVTNGNGTPLVIKKEIKHEHISLDSPVLEFMLTPNDGIENGPNDLKNEGASKDAPEGFNQYRNQKSFSQGMLDIALFTSNVNQLRAVTKNPPASMFEYSFVIILLMASILIQIAVGLMLLLSARYNVNKEEERKAVYRMGNYVVSGIFLITIFNLFIAVFYNYENAPATQPNNSTS